MKSISLFVLGHTDAVLATYSGDDRVIPVNLNALDISDRLRGQDLAENRFFLADFLDTVDSEWIGLLTGRWEDKFPQYPPIMQIPDHVDFLRRPDQAIAPALFWWPSPDVPRFSRRQDLRHPGMRALLDDPDAPQITAVHRRGMSPLAYNNQLIAHRTVVAGWVDFLRRSFDYYDAQYGLDLPFEVKCPTCGALCRDGDGGRTSHPTGLRYDPTRHAGYFYEQITAKYFLGQLLDYRDFDGSASRPRIGSSLAASAYWRIPAARKLGQRVQRTCSRPTAPGTAIANPLPTTTSYAPHSSGEASAGRGSSAG